MKNFQKLSTLPTSVLTELKPTEPSESDSSPLQPDSGTPGISEQDLFNTANHTKTTMLEGITDIPNNPNVPTIPAPVNQGAKLGNVVGGKTAVDLIDILFPSLCVWGISAIGYKIGKGKLQMTAKEKEALIPAMQNYLDSINVNFDNPLYNLLFVLGSIYASKVIDILPDLEKVKTTKKESAKIIEMSKPKTDDEIVLEIYKKRKKSKQDATDYFIQHREIFINAPTVDEAIKYIKENSK